MDAAAIIVMLVVGAIAGFLASLVVGGPWGLLGYIVAGIIGGVVGGWLLGVAKVNLNLGSPIVNQIVTAAIGAIVVILIARLIASPDSRGRLGDRPGQHPGRSCILRAGASGCPPALFRWPGEGK
jgi:uncharacterized membrane protein YeaQ/YmgE (transglycosylase-associated protein family)